MSADKSEHRVQSTWQVMAVRERIVLGCPSGHTIVLRLVSPPVVLLSSGAHHIYYGLKHHPVYASTNRLLELLAQQCEHKVCLWESDGAYSNERLMAHVFHKNKSEDFPYLNLHCKCMNHQTQLLKVSLLACSGNDLLGRLYGMAQFLRNLGYWLRMRQAFAEWVSDSLIFKQEIFSKDVAGHVTPSPTLLQLIDFVRSARNMESKELHQSFDKKVQAFLDLWNGDVSKGEPIHICSHYGLPPHERHCTDRADAIRKCIKTFFDLFMVLPTVPAPNKWTTMFSCVDFVMSGIVIHKWLRQIFVRAFRDMQFAEFDSSMAAADPKLVETLSFHAVNGRRHDSTVNFLHSDSAMWALALLSIAMEGSRALTWFWLGCLGNLQLMIV